MPLNLALAVRETVAGRRLGAVHGGGGGGSPPPMHPLEGPGGRYAFPSLRFPDPAASAAHEELQDGSRRLYHRYATPSPAVMFCAPQEMRFR